MNTFAHIWAWKHWSVIQFKLWVLAWTDPLSKPGSIGGLRLGRVLQSQGAINMVGEGNDLPVWVRSSLPLMPITPSCHQLHTDTFWTAPLSCNPVGLYHHLRNLGEEKDFRAITTKSLLVSQGNLLFTYHWSPAPLQTPFVFLLLQVLS